MQSLYEKHLGVEFQSEIQTLSKVEHLNLVKLYGYLDQGDERIIVVEYVPNGTLREHLDCEFLKSFSYCLFVIWPSYSLTNGLVQAFMGAFWTLLHVWM